MKPRESILKLRDTHSAETQQLLTSAASSDFNMKRSGGLAKSDAMSESKSANHESVKNPELDSVMDKTVNKAEPKKKATPATDPKASDPKARQKRKGSGSKQTTYPSAEHAKLVELSKEHQNKRVCRFFNASTSCTDDECSFINKCMKCGSTAHGYSQCPER